MDGSHDIFGPAGSPAELYFGQVVLLVLPEIQVAFRFSRRSPRRTACRQFHWSDTDLGLTSGHLAKVAKKQLLIANFRFFLTLDIALATPTGTI
jgi:hypothetical protein